MQNELGGPKAKTNKSHDRKGRIAVPCRIGTHDVCHQTNPRDDATRETRRTIFKEGTRTVVASATAGGASCGSVIHSSG
jgi:hypothetical protein